MGETLILPSFPRVRKTLYIYIIYIYIYIYIYLYMYIYYMYMYYVYIIYVYIYIYIYTYMYIYALNLFIEHSGKHWWEQNAFCSFTIPQDKMAKLSTWWFQHSVDISSSLLVNPSHTDESWEEWCESLIIELLTVMSCL